MAAYAKLKAAESRAYRLLLAVEVLAPVIKTVTSCCSRQRASLFAVIHTLTICQDDIAYVADAWAKTAMVSKTLLCSKSCRDVCSQTSKPDAMAVSTCSNGLAGYEASNVCCPVSCGTCGGLGCGSLGDGCCTSDVLESGDMCSTTGSAPCVIVGGDTGERLWTLFLSSSLM